MKSTAQTAILAAVLTACAGPSAGGQSTTADPGQIGRVHLYEVPDSDIEALRRQSAEEGWIEVSGTGSVEVRPDRARVAFAMETRGETAAAAADANAEAMSRVLEALRSAGLEGLELATYGYSLRPEYQVEDNRRTQRIIAYTVLNNVGATLSDVDAVGRAIDAGVRAGANRVAGISFFASETDAARREALAQAVEVARAEAEVMARALGHTLGPALEVRGGAQRPGPVPYAMEMSAMRAADTPVEVGDQTVTASVTIRFALGPESGG
jgi:uncharacterized protein YggE